MRRPTAALFLKCCCITQWSDFLTGSQSRRTAKRFLLEGALLLTAWPAPVSRHTNDIDLLDRAYNQIEVVVGLMKEVSQFDVADDGIVYEAGSFSGVTIREDADCSGVPTMFKGRLDTEMCGHRF